MLSIHKQIAHELVKTYKPDGAIRFSERMERTYQKCLGQFDLDTLHQLEPYLDVNNINTVDKVGCEIWKLFPAHYFKFQEVLLRDLLQKSVINESTPFGTPNITIIDLGAGVGTAALAVIDLIASWIQICVKWKIPPLRTSIRVIPVERNDKKLDVTNDLWSYFIEQLADEQLYPNILLVEHLPHVSDLFGTEECNNSIISLAGNGYSTFICASNIINWIPEADFTTQLSDLINQLPFCRKMLVISETDKEKLKNQVQKLIQHFEKSHTIDPDLKPLFNMTGVKYYNPPNSFFYDPSRKRPYRNNKQLPSAIVALDLGCGDSHIGHCQASSLSQCSTNEHCHLFWSKARYELYRNPVVDDIGCKLVETQIDWHMERLNRSIRCQDLRQWYQSTPVFYKQPKPSGGYRISVIPNVLDATSALCLMQPIGMTFSSDSNPHSFAYKLDAIQDGGVSHHDKKFNYSKGEFLYEYYGNSHRSYVNTVRDALSSGDTQYVSVDIQSFYPSVVQNQLNDLSLSYINGCCRLMKSQWTMQVSRTIPEQTDGQGLLIGHPVSGLISNIYLKPLDKLLLDAKGKMHVGYHRYVDDMTFILSDQNPQDVAKSVNVLLNNQYVNLHLNAGKSMTGGLVEYESRMCDDVLEQISERVKYILYPLYNIPWLWRRYHSKDESAFCAWYGDRLNDLGVFITWRHLWRKLHSILSTRRWWMHLPWRGIDALDWSSITEVSVVPTPNWVASFKKSNNKWCDLKTELAQDCYDLASNSFSILAATG